MWVVIFYILAALGLLSAFYLLTRFRRFTCIRKIAEQHKLLSWIIAAIPVCGLLCFYFFNLFTLFTVLIHLMGIWAFCDLIAFLVRKKKKQETKRYYAGGAALCLTAALLCVGWYNAHHIYETHYTFQSGKCLNGESLRIAMFADSHLGITLDGAAFSAQMERIQATNPDLVVICGDFVDDDSSKADLLTACEALGKMQTTYGVYYAYGNHDTGYYKNRDFTDADMRDALTQNGIVILEDTVVPLNDSFDLIGRLDSSFDRVDAGILNESLDSSKYQILLDHKPNDYEAEAAAGYDLVLSGHTHGGHIFPAGPIGVAIGANDWLYGVTQRENTNFVVTSGISGWAIPFKTGAISEYCIIDITEA